MDDIAILENNKDRLIDSLDIVETFRKKFKLELSDTKCLILIINKDKLDEHRTWKIGNMELPITEQYTYLGQVIHQSGTIKQHLKLKETKSTALVRNIVCLSKDSILNRMTMDTVLELYQKCIIPMILYGS